MSSYSRRRRWGGNSKRIGRRGSNGIMGETQHRQQEARHAHADDCTYATNWNIPLSTVFE